MRLLNVYLATYTALSLTACKTTTGSSTAASDDVASGHATLIRYSADQLRDAKTDWGDAHFLLQTIASDAVDQANAVDPGAVSFSLSSQDRTLSMLVEPRYALETSADVDPSSMIHFDFDKYLPVSITNDGFIIVSGTLQTHLPIEIGGKKLTRDCPYPVSFKMEAFGYIGTESPTESNGYQKPINSLKKLSGTYTWPVLAASPKSLSGAPGSNVACPTLPTITRDDVQFQTTGWTYSD